MSSEVVLLGDSIFDNRMHVAVGQSVKDHLQEMLPHTRISMLAADGATTADVLAQQKNFDSRSAQLFLSVGGNDALLHAALLDTPVASSADVLRIFSNIGNSFEATYNLIVSRCLKMVSRMSVCTIYEGSFADEDYQRRVSSALSFFNDRITKIALANHVEILDLRTVCSVPEDFVKNIEPSMLGGRRIAQAVATSFKRNCLG
ncbi:SGNH/GDSL hydrolase family protein [Variovorax sp. MHTC-1]|uniref:SGNH/GDSL hydrolase family protein n=1 Tax=Variovorax sp. MHTC-1 TaxID=2495593 RepID=UPI000F892DC4|nr:SGNH/GDSL hydrolase family protein [Variovorax sp. MHTC-1]RST50671.1 SGNH/GDSL hydrolase family protein [Variovorax sp. MHTC-1]